MLSIIKGKLWFREFDRIVLLIIREISISKIPPAVGKWSYKVASKEEFYTHTHTHTHTHTYTHTNSFHKINTNSLWNFLYFTDRVTAICEKFLQDIATSSNSTLRQWKPLFKNTLWRKQYADTVKEAFFKSSVRYLTLLYLNPVSSAAY